MKKDKSKGVHLITLVVGFLLSITYFYFTRFIIGPDDINYISYSSYLLGNSGQIPEVYPSDLSKVFHLPMIGYPWGTTVILAAVQVVTGLSALNAYVLVKVICTTAIFYFMGHFMMTFTGTPIKPIYRLLIFFLNFPTSVILSYHFVSDTLSQLLFLCALALSLKVQWSTSRRVGFFVLIGLLCFLPGFFRYQYYLLGYSVPAGIILFFVWQGKWNSTLLRNVGIVVFSITLFNLINVFFLKYVSDTYYFLNDNYAYQKDGLYWENLRLITPIFIESFYDIKRIQNQISNPLVGTIFLGFTFLSSLFIILYIYFKKNYMSEYKAPTYTVFFVVITFFVVNFLLLAILSVLEPPQRINNQYWSYIGETRYYSVPMFFVLIIVIVLYTKEKIMLIRRIFSLFIFSSILIAYAFWARDILRANTDSGLLDLKEKYSFLENRMMQSADQVLYADYSMSSINLISSLNYTKVVDRPGGSSIAFNVYDRLINSQTLESSTFKSMIINVDKDDMGLTSLHNEHSVILELRNSLLIEVSLIDKK